MKAIKQWTNAFKSGSEVEDAEIDFLISSEFLSMYIHMADRISPADQASWHNWPISSAIALYCIKGHATMYSSEPESKEMRSVHNLFLSRREIYEKKEVLNLTDNDKTHIDDPIFDGLYDYESVVGECALTLSEIIDENITMEFANLVDVLVTSTIDGKWEGINFAKILNEADESY